MTEVPDQADQNSLTNFKKGTAFQGLNILKIQSKIYNTYCPLLSLSLMVEKSIGFLITFL